MCLVLASSSFDSSFLMLSCIILELKYFNCLPYFFPVILLFSIDSIINFTCMSELTWWHVCGYYYMKIASARDIQKACCIMRPLSILHWGTQCVFWCITRIVKSTTNQICVDSAGRRFLHLVRLKPAFLRGELLNSLECNDT